MFIDSHKGGVVFASCRLTSASVDKIDKAGMWDDGTLQVHGLYTIGHDTNR